MKFTWWIHSLRFPHIFLIPFLVFELFKFWLCWVFIATASSSLLYAALFVCHVLGSSLVAEHRLLPVVASFVVQHKL